jgi:hypothetical protein
VENIGNEPRCLDRLQDALGKENVALGVVQVIAVGGAVQVVAVVVLVLLDKVGFMPSYSLSTISASTKDCDTWQDILWLEYFIGKAEVFYALVLGENDPDVNPRSSKPSGGPR